MKKIIFLFLLLPYCLIAQSGGKLFQYSTIGALMNGNYDGGVSFKELSGKGNFGIGTLDNLDGEMIALDAVFYQITDKGKVQEIPQNKETPFAILTFFNSEKTIHISNKVTNSGLEAIITELLDETSYPVAIKITGEFESIKTRSVPAQKRPFPTLSEAVKKQTVFNYSNVKGTLVGFYFPKYFEGINVPGFHFHFLSDDKTKGGHAMEYVVVNPKIIPNFCTSIDLKLLDKFENGKTTGSPDLKELEKIEK